MANPDHLAKLKEGVEAWNEWRSENCAVLPDLCWANLRGVSLAGADLQGVDLRYAFLRDANLRGVNLQGAKLSGAELSRAAQMPEGISGYLDSPEGWRKGERLDACE